MESPKLFKMYGALFMEVTPQPHLMKSKLNSSMIARGRKFCVNLITGQLTTYDPGNYREEEPKQYQFILRNSANTASTVLECNWIQIEKTIRDTFETVSPNRWLFYCSNHDRIKGAVGFPYTRSFEESVAACRELYEKINR